MKIVCLSSGGLDSSLMMLLLKKQDHEVFPLHINYGQLAEEREWESCRRVASFENVNEPCKIDISGLEVTHSGLLDQGLDIVKDAFLPTRNLIFLTFGSAYAFSLGCTAVGIGILANPIFPDQKAEFIHSAEQTISIALGNKLRVLAPLLELDKRDVIKLARKSGLPFELTYYCHAGTEKPCGKCISCQERIAAEKMLEIEDGGV